VLRSIFITLTLLIVHLGNAQDGSLIANTKTSNIDFKINASFYGLWEVQLVTIGGKSMTPVAKWFQINEDGTVTGGNGWAQNVESTWEHKDINNELLFITDGVPDEYGAFTVQTNGDAMTWIRNEDGKEVHVTLERINSKPLGPWEKIVGVWKVRETVGINPDDQSQVKKYELDPTWYVIRWDRRFQKYDANGKRNEAGIWHIESHSLSLSLFNDESTERQNWQIEFVNGQMVWISEQSGEILKLTFEKDTEIGNGN